MSKSILTIDASTINSMIQIMDGLREKLGSPVWHGSSIDAFIDSMVYGGVNQVSNPEVIISNLNLCDNRLIEEVKEFAFYINKAANEAGKSAMITLKY